MTEFVVELIRLHGDERWSDWGDGWWKHVERLGELTHEGFGGWPLLDHFRSEGVHGTKLDWGALMFPVTKKQLIDLYSAESELRPFSGTPEGERMQLSDLLEGERYGLVVEER